MLAGTSRAAPRSSATPQAQAAPLSSAIPSPAARSGPDAAPREAGADASPDTTPSTPAGPAPAESVGSEQADGLLLAARRSNRLLAGILLILTGAAFYTAAAFFMPVVLALLLALTLSPLVRFLHRRGLGEGIAAALVVLVLALGIGGAFAALGTPFFDLVNDAPRMAGEVREKFEQIREPISTVTDVAEQVDDATGAGTDVQQVTVQQPGILSQVAGSAVSIVTTTVIVIILTLFLLASGDHFSEQIIKSFGTLTDKKRALRTLRDVEGEISRYLLTITLINAGLGLAVGLAMWLLGMPTPVLWGALAAVLNFLPYIGSLGGIAIVSIVSLATFPTIAAAILPPLAYFACTAIEGQFVTPTVVGRRLRINTVAVFVAVAFWSFLWSIPGALMAVPILVLLKVLCDNVSGLHGLGRFLSAEADDEPAKPAAMSVGP